MVGNVFCLEDSEREDFSRCGGYPYAKANKSRWVPFDFEEGSIDCNIATEARFVINDIVYKVCRQYFIKDSGKTTRLLVLEKAKSDCETVKIE